mgnify:CR=1 FL=1
MAKRIIDPSGGLGCPAPANSAVARLYSVCYQIVRDFLVERGPDENLLCLSCTQSMSIEPFGFQTMCRFAASGMNEKQKEEAAQWLVERLSAALGAEHYICVVVD